MKIIALTDIHGAYETAGEILTHEAETDMIVVGGDLTTMGSPGEADRAVGRLLQFGKPLLVVAGNMDPPELEEVFDRRGVGINGRGVMVAGVGFFGVSAAPVSPLRTPYEIDEEEILRRAETGWKEVSQARYKVFVPHAPPRDTLLDRVHGGLHVGSSAVRQFVEKHQPDVTICGHIHESRGRDVIGRVPVINCGPAGSGFYGVVVLKETVECRNCRLSKDF